MVSSQDPPHGLRLAIDFVNTLEIEAETDVLITGEALYGWLEDHALPAPAAIGQAELDRAVALREALRTAMLAHNGGAPDDRAQAELERVARRGQLSVSFDPDDRIGLSPRADNFDGVLAELLVPVAMAAADGSWKRVKACRAGDCHWAFYDTSRNRSGRWCDMSVCGNRTKVRAYRTKRTR